jgi:alkylation response protein AidB-like acyl-CoA dehydrogenase
MGHYKSNLRDIEFNLFEVLGRDDVLGHGPYEETDVETARHILTEVDRLAREDLAAPFADDDRKPAVYDPAARTVTVPEGMRAAYRAWMDSGFWHVGLPAEIGGQPAPPSLVWAMSELVLGANPGVYLYNMGPAFGAILYHLATEKQKTVARLMIEHEWNATMQLTEPDAGSDVGAGKTKAFPQADGSWHLTGVKRFITAGEHDLSDNIVHLVLARPVGVEGAGGPGTKGLSLFLVPKFLFDWDTGELGARNGIYATNVERKMGIKVSATCEMTLGDGEPCVGWLVGDVHDGIAQMFQVIEQARMMVGTKAISTLSSGYLNALDYAKERTQGADLTQAADKTAPRVKITSHPDVRRSLMTQKAFAEGMRALVLYTASMQDTVALAAASGEHDPLAESVNDLLLPIVKGYGSERAWVLLGSESLQTYGGSGFLQDYPVEQYVRDAKIDTLYEGTTAIQGQDFFFRKIVKNHGQAITWLAGQISEFAANGSSEDGRLKEERDLLATALGEVQAMLGSMFGFLMSANPKAEGTDVRNVYKVGLNTTRLLMATGDVVVAWLLLRQAEVAQRALAGELSPAETAFYTGKVAAAQWFASQVLPRLAAERAIMESTDNAVMDLPLEAF